MIVMASHCGISAPIRSTQWLSSDEMVAIVVGISMRCVHPHSPGSWAARQDAGRNWDSCVPVVVSPDVTLYLTRVPSNSRVGWLRRTE